ncbi:MAG: BatA domain-containing protein [Phycisphaerae bacterium]
MIDFASPLLLIGLLAAGIPFLLHLLSSVKAREAEFPTLRFLKMSMEKTARRRKIQHWLLLALRSLLLAALAIAVAQPILKSTGGLLGGENTAAVIVLDNSYSMAVQSESGSRFEQARLQAGQLLSGERRPAMAAVMTTAPGGEADALSADLPALRQRIGSANISYASPLLDRRVARAIDLLGDTDIPRKAIYVFSDMQRESFADLPALKELAEAEDVHLFIVRVGKPATDNVGISDLEITGRRVVDSALEITATLVNSADRAQVATAHLRINGSETGKESSVRLSPAGTDGSTAAVRFRHRFRTPGPVTGEIYLDRTDDLSVDNTRRFVLEVTGKVDVLIVRGPAEPADGSAPDSGAVLSLALQPHIDANAPWPIRTRTMEHQALSADSLAGVKAVFVTNVPRFSEAQARELASFTAGGGTLVMLPGPATDASNYNRMLVEGIPDHGGLLPARLEPAVGQVGPTAEAVPVDYVNTRHPYLEDLWDRPAGSTTVLVKRYFPLEPVPGRGTLLMRLANGKPLMMVRSFGQGQVLLSATGAYLPWSDLPLNVLLPLAARVSVLSAREDAQPPALPAETRAQIRPRPTGPQTPDTLRINLATPADDAAAGSVALTARRTEDGYLAEFGNTERVGLYRWRVTQPGVEGGVLAGSFAVNPSGGEARLDAVETDRFQARANRMLGQKRIYIGSSLADAMSVAEETAKGVALWDLFLAGAIILLVAEAVLANRRKLIEETI